MVEMMAKELSERWPSGKFYTLRKLQGSALTLTLFEIVQTPKESENV